MSFSPLKTLPVAILLLAAASSAQAQSFSGTIGDGDSLKDDFRPYDAYTITVKERQMVTIRMMSSEFDTYLIARSPSGLEYYNDDYEGQESSQIDLVAPEAGKWTVMAAGYDQSAEGAYSVEVTLGEVGQAKTIQGRLDRSDTLSIKGEFYDTHTMDITSPTPFHVELISLGFDGYLVVRSPDGEYLRNDDAENTNTSRIGPLTGAGTWTIFVTSASEAEFGAYDLNVITFP